MEEPSFFYAVRIAIDDARVFAAYVDWLRDVHLGDMCASGARVAELFVMDVRPGEPSIVLCHYRFESREAFSRYEREEAPRLRAHGLAELARLGAAPGTGVSFQRDTGSAVFRRRCE